MALCKTAVLKFYNHIIEDVISGVRNTLINEGIDEQILQELKELWKLKLLASKAVYINSTISEPNETTNKPDSTASNTAEAVKQDANCLKLETQQFVKTEEIQQQYANNEFQTVTIQITLPILPVKNAKTRIIKIKVPVSALNGLQLQKLLTGPVMSATMGLPTSVATCLIQQHINAVIQSQKQQQTTKKVVKPEIDDSSNAVPKKKHKKSKTIIVEFISRADGANDTSDEDDDNTSEVEMYEEEEDDDSELDDDALEEEPLNSDDDISDEEPNDLFNSDNIVVCQCDKIIRIKNKWKFYLKDGIMNLDGEDYVFRKASGDADW